MELIFILYRYKALFDNYHDLICLFGFKKIKLNNKLIKDP